MMKKEVASLTIYHVSGLVELTNEINHGIVCYGTVGFE